VGDTENSSWGSRELGGYIRREEARMHYRNLSKTIDAIVDDTRPLLDEEYEPMSEAEFEALLLRANDAYFERLLREAEAQQKKEEVT
jgi:hypothetical protein